MQKQSAVQVKVGGQALSADGYNALAEVHVHLDIDALSMFSLRLRAGDLTDTEIEWIDDDTFAPGTEVSISLGYAGALTELMTGEVTGIELEMAPGETPSVVVRGYDPRHRLLRTRQTRSFANMKDSAIASKIASEVKLSASVVDSAVTHEYVLQDSVSDFDFLKQRADLIGFAVVVDEKTLYFGPHKYDASASATLATGTDLIDVYLKLSTQGLPGSVVVQGWDPATKKAVTATAAASDVKKMGRALGLSAGDSVFGKAMLTFVNRGVDTQDAAAQIAKGKIQIAALDYIRGEATCFGRTDIKAGMVVALEGLGTHFSGNYYVTSAKHSYLPDEGYRTAVSMRRNAT